MKGEKKKKILSIRTQIVASFIVPVLFVILVGVISYQKAEEGMAEKYTDSTIQALNMVVGYIDYGCEMVEAEAFKYAYDTQLNSYYLGLLNKKSADKADVYNTNKSALRNSALVNPMIQGIYIITGNGMDILTSGTELVQNGFLDEWKKEEEIKAGWYDRHTYLDEKMSVDPNGYALNYYCLSDGGKACVVVDIKSDEIRSIMNRMNLAKGSVAAFVTTNGKEILSDSNFEIIISQQDFYKDTMNSEEISGAEYVTYQQDKYLYLYSKSERTGAMVCLLVPEKQVIEQANSIRTLTILLVLITPF